MDLMKLRGVSKSYGRGDSASVVLQDIDLSVEEGEFVAIVGFSGSGKTTLISLMAGLEQSSSGTIEFDGETVTAPDPSRGVVFQNYSLMPWLSVESNVALAVDAAFAGEPRRVRRLPHSSKYLPGMMPACFRR